MAFSFLIDADRRTGESLLCRAAASFASTIFFGTEEQPAGGRLIDWARFHFFDRIHLWFREQDNCSPLSPDDCSNTITLSEAFYTEIDQHRVPMEREVVIALANSP